MLSTLSTMHNLSTSSVRSTICPQYCLQCNTIANAIDNAIDNSSLYNALYLEGLLTITFSLPRYSHFLTITFTFSSLSLSHYCLSRVPTFSVLAFSAYLFDAILTFRDFSLRFTSSRYVALRESLENMWFHIKKQCKSSDLSGKVTLLVSRW